MIGIYQLLRRMSMFEKADLQPSSDFWHAILERYGITETLMNTSNPYTGECRTGDVGLPLSGISAQLLDRNGNRVLDGEPGELYIRGLNVFYGRQTCRNAAYCTFTTGC
jgi:acyl-coenzyme A synthetase/AMP-(fatty) acid ligase